MSEFAEAVRAAVTEDWLTTTEIMEKVPVGPRLISPRSHVYGHLQHLVLAALSDGKGHTVREVTEEIYGASAERWMYNSVRRVLATLESTGAVARERSRTVVPVWIYSLREGPV